MDNIYLLMVVALAILAIADLIVGVSNDAVNFLNSAIGSKAVSFRTIMIVASVGIAAGAIFSSGLMEVARKGIFNPGEFYFDEIMIIFMAVMITDILLLDFFNTLGMPTSTTVSIVFNLLGAAVCVALIKIADQGQSFADLDNYINTKTATKIIKGILQSVVIAFSVGALVQFITRLLLSYNFEKKAKWVGALFGGVALTALLYFIFMKGIKGTAYAKAVVDIVYNGGTEGLLDWANNYFGSTYESIKELAKAKKDLFKIDAGAGTIKMTLRGLLETFVLQIVAIGFVFWSILSFILIKFFKINIYKLIIIVGTFGLALAFSGNDLVNFIGVPIAGWEGYQLWLQSDKSADEFLMTGLASKQETEFFLLLAAGLIMVLTLWFSKKARYVAETEINLSREGESKERFKPNFLSRGIVRTTVLISQGLTAITPKPAKDFIEKQLAKPVIDLPKDKTYQLPAFDMVRAAVNLVVAGVLISIATSMGLPLSTTYVTFMVAMGTSLSDRAWGTESAVYRVAGVLNVIGGWFFTAISAFIAAAIVAFLINLGGSVMIAVLLLVAVLLLARNTINYRKRVKAEKAEDSLKSSESSSVQGVIEESADNIKSFVNRGNKIYMSTIDSLVKYDLIALKKSKKGIAKLDEEVEELRDNIFYFIKNLDESSVGASNFYINILGYLQDMSQSLEYITKASHKHVNNNHKKLRFNQIKDLKEIEEQLKEFFGQIKKAFSDREFESIDKIINEKQELFNKVNKKIDKQVARTRTEESSPKNTTLYFGLLLETKDLITATMNLLETYRDHK
ncbi:inorganic phosphate transporter [Aquimarina sp. I32.4]|uniref:inorganic phosphate transporter n=1 Tax=Aquimarina sp. I32.4 TaxID=2053903 RepID=UPI000CDE9D8D|nr:inorganic phosphate transporter [Aquimarina sp. I32.4]